MFERLGLASESSTEAVADCMGKPVSYPYFSMSREDSANETNPDPFHEGLCDDFSDFKSMRPGIGRERVCMSFVRTAKGSGIRPTCGDVERKKSVHARC